MSSASGTSNGVAAGPGPRPVLAYIGLGLMGGPMSAHLVSRGWTVRGFDTVAARCDAAADRKSVV